MAFTPQFLDELRTRIGLADVVSKRVKLTRKGHEHSGLCPFHKEKTPSFTVNEDKGFYHCFGCGEHGSAIDFVMKTEGLNFPEAVERLAHDAGMEVPVDSPEERQRAMRRQTLYDVTEKAAAFYERTLRMPEGRAGLDYLRGRGLDDATIAKFRIGFAPDGRGVTKAALRREGIADELMVAAGMLIEPEGQDRDSYDRFRGRIMFPITDRRGRVIAFGGRLLADDEKAAKYLNSPETPLFHKGRVLYGLDHAVVAARKAGTVIVTEGYMDVIALSKAGFSHAVAPLGTALTEEQIGEMWRLVREPVLCFDGDNAGQRAATRAAERALPLLKPGYGLRFAQLPQGQDPDSLIGSNGPAAMADIIARAEPLSEILWRMETGGRLPKTPEQRASVQKALEDHARRIADSTVRGHFSRNFRDRLWVGGGKQAGSRAGRGGAVSLGAGAGQVDAGTVQEKILLATLIGHPGLYDDVGERLGNVAFLAPGLDILRQEVLKTMAGAEGLDSDGVERHLRDSGFSEILDSILGPDFLLNAFFARRDTDIETALEGWEETYALYRNTELRIEIQEEQQRLTDGMTPENFNRLRSTAEQKNEAMEGLPDTAFASVSGVATKH
ncbi:MAG: DNA primase [Rhodospirillaceae bacterium]|nr:DNA primase [Rhodospirillaceae bacterium]